MTDKILVVLSGGQDSTTCLFLAVSVYGADNVSTITFNYGQRHSEELRAARTVARLAGVAMEDRIVVDIPNILRSTSPLLSDSSLKQYTDYPSMIEQVGDNVEETFVPMRNVFFLTVALNHAVAMGCNKVVIGVSQEDSANYPDCSFNFIRSYFEMANAAGIRVDIVTPLIGCTKATTVKLMHSLGPKAWNALAYTHTSYAGEYPPVDMNHANVLRARGFEEAGLPDPLVLRAFEEGFMSLPTTSNYDAAREGKNVLFD